MTADSDRRSTTTQAGRGIYAAPPGHQAAALRGASLAFNKPPVKHTIMSSTSSGTNAALAAAVTAGVSNQTTASSRSLGNRGNIAYDTIPPSSSSQRATSSGINQGIREQSAPRILQKPYDRQSSGSPSSIAAKLATARHIPQTQQTSVAAGRRLIQQRNRDEEVMQDTGARTDTEPIAPTNTLIGLFERKSSSQPSEELSSPANTGALPEIQSPRPIRPLTKENVGLGGALVAAKQWRPTDAHEVSKVQTSDNRSSSYGISIQSEKPPRSPNDSRGPPTNTSSSVIGSRVLRRTSSNRSSASIIRDIHNRPTGASDDSSSVSSYASVSERPPKPALPPPRRSTPRASTNSSKPPASRAEHTNAHTSGLSRTTQTVASSVSIPTSSSQLSLESGISSLQPQEQADIGKWRRTPIKPGTRHLTEDSLADAIVASSLASSRAASPTKMNAPPLPARHANPQLFRTQNHHQQDILTSRTPSPAKGMRHTMRRPLKSDDDNHSGSGAHRHARKNPLKKHPNKHHEGDRKRWRDEVTESERKRYEGVWAANRGLCIPDHGTDPASPEPSAADAAKSMVLNVVVRDIWSRSRLPDHVLEEVWDLVDHQAVGTLTREEFVVGMWLIDQRLKGRKLPVKVSESVWASVRRLSGIKLSTNRYM